MTVVQILVYLRDLDEGARNARVWTGSCVACCFGPRTHEKYCAATACRERAMRNSYAGAVKAAHAARRLFPDLLVVDDWQPIDAKPRFRIWALAMAFKKNGFPSVGTFGRTSRNVVIVPVETWTKLCDENPRLQTTKFEVGGYE